MGSCCERAPLLERAQDWWRSGVLLLCLPGLRQIDETTVAVDLQGVHRNTAVKGQGQLICRAPRGGVGGGGRRCVGRGETGDPCAVGGDREAPGAALGRVEVAGGGLCGRGVVVAQQVARNSSTPSIATSSGSGCGAPRVIWASYVCNAISRNWCRATAPDVCGDSDVPFLDRGHAAGPGLLRRSGVLGHGQVRSMPPSRTAYAAGPPFSTARWIALRCASSRSTISRVRSCWLSM